MNKTLFLTLLYLLGCSSIPKPMPMETRDFHLKQREYSVLIKELEATKDYVSDKDYLLHQLNYAILLHYDGQYAKSNKVFEECQQIVQWEGNLTEVSEMLGVVVSPNIKKFKLDEYEILTISLFKMLNALNLGQIQNAQAESKRLDRLGNYFKDYYKSNLIEETAFHSYLSAIVWESQQTKNKSSLDMSYINYKKVFNSGAKNNPYITWDLWRTAYKLDRQTDLAYWEEQFRVPDKYKLFVKSEHKQTTLGEVIIIMSTGKGPFKTLDPNFNGTKIMFARGDLGPHTVEVKINDEDRGETFPVVDFYELAKANLTSRTSGVVGTMGSLFGIDLHDRRHWDLVPNNIQMARIVIEEGTHKLDLKFVGNYDPISTYITVKKGQKTLLNIHQP